MAHLFASTTGTDSDWIVKLIDVYPERYEPDRKMGGYELMIADEVFRGRFRKSFEKPEAIVAGEVTRLRSICTRTTTCSRRGTVLWCRCRARGFR